MNESDLTEWAARFRRDGFVHAKAVLDVTALEPLGRVVDAAVAARKKNDTRALHEKTPYEQSFVQCEYLWEDNPEVRPLTFHPIVAGIAAALLAADKVRLWHDQALYKEAGGRETEAHQDHPYWPIAEYRTLTAWIPLCLVDRSNGCMGYVPGSHLGAVEFVNIFAGRGDGETLAAKQAAEPVFVPAELGDVVFHDGRTVHLAGPNRSLGTRRVYTAIYFKDGCTRAARQGHPSVDRDRIAVGRKIEGPATPVAWPLPDGKLPEPGPWPDAPDEWMTRARRVGVMPQPRP